MRIWPASGGSGGGSANRNVRVLHAADYPYAVAASDDLLLVDTDAITAPELDLGPAAARNGRRLIIIRLDGNPGALTLNADAGEDINGAASLVLPSVGTLSLDLDPVGNDGIGFVNGWSVASSAAGALELQAGPTIAGRAAGLIKLGSAARPFEVNTRGLYFRGIFLSAAANIDLQSYHDITLCDTDTFGAGMSVNLNGIDDGQLHVIVNTGATYSLVVGPGAGDDIDGAASLVVLPGETATLVGLGTRWYRCDRPRIAYVADAVAAKRWMAHGIKTLTFGDSPYTIQGDEPFTTYLVDATGGAVVVNLPAVDSNPPKPHAITSLGWLVRIQKMDASANTVTVNRNGTDVINGAGLTNVVLAAQDDAFCAQAVGSYGGVRRWVA